jgi:hypothetical protein
MLHPDTMPGGWESVEDGAHPSVEDELVALEDREDEWADELTDAVEHRARQQVARGAAAQIGAEDIYDSVAAGIPSGRCTRTEHEMVTRIRAAIRDGGPHQPRLPLSLSAGPRPRSRRGRPRGPRVWDALAHDCAQGVLL